MLKVEKKGKGWALVASALGEVQERSFHYKKEAERAKRDFEPLTEYQLQGLFNNYFQPSKEGLLRESLSAVEGRAKLELFKIDDKIRLCIVGAQGKLQAKIEVVESSLKKAIKSLEEGKPNG